MTVFVSRFYDLGALLHESDSLNQERLMEHAAETMAANADLGTMHDAYVIRHQLFTWSGSSRSSASSWRT